MPPVLSLIGTCLDIAATLALAVSLVLVLILFADLFLPLADVAADPSGLLSVFLLLGLLFMPAIWCSIVWPIHMCQKRRGARVYGWVRFVVLASAAWTWVMYRALTTL